MLQHAGYFIKYYSLLYLIQINHILNLIIISYYNFKPI